MDPTRRVLKRVNIEDAQPPKEVQAAFDDVIRAKEDEARVKNEAETYRNGIVPEARGMAQRQYEEAIAYKDRVVARAEGESTRFAQLLAEYEKNPRVTRQRLYLDSMERIMANTSKVLVDGNGAGNNNMLYLPLDKLMGQSQSSEPVVPLKATEVLTPDVAPPLLDSNRMNSRREAR